VGSANRLPQSGLALILVTLYDASTAQVGWILTVYNASGFVASLLVPSYADRREDYLRPMLACGVLTLVLALVLAFTTSLPVAVVALVVVGGPAGVGSSMLYAHLRHSGAKPADIVNTRAIVSVAWIAGPPVATLIIGAFGNRAHPPHHRGHRRSYHRHLRRHDLAVVRRTRP
jgi:SET family sugar efflux transporter-like MFS transporter